MHSSKLNSCQLVQNRTQTPSERTARILQGLGNHDRFRSQTAVYQASDTILAPRVCHCTQSKKGWGCPGCVRLQLGDKKQPHPGTSPADGYCSQFCSWKSEIRCQPGEAGEGVPDGSLFLLCRCRPACPQERQRVSKFSHEALTPSRGPTLRTHLLITLITSRCHHSGGWGFSVSFWGTHTHSIHNRLA